MLRYALVLFLFALAGCAAGTEDFGRNDGPNTRVTELSTVERQRKIPNPAFGGVWNASLEQVDRALNDDPSLAESTNADGDTPFGLALIEGRPGIAARVMRGLSPRALRHRNLRGESYVYLAARAGFADLVTALGNAHYDTLGSLERYDFSDVDRRTKGGQRALFVAANRVVAETLEAQHYRGFLKGPWRQFMLERDKAGQNFLHAAARDGRDDLIFWAGERLCNPSSLEQSKRWYISWPRWGVSYATGLAQTYVIGDLRLWFDSVVNRRDKNGRTPLHVAIENKQWGAVRALSHCAWTDYDLADARGDLPLHAFLEQANPEIATHGRDVYDAFDFLIAQDTNTRLTTLPYRVRRVNHDGNTPLHLAAQLADPYFYTALARTGDVYAVNRAGMSAERLFQTRRSQVSQNGK